MLNHALVPMDGTTDSEGALKLVRRFMNCTETGSLTLLRVVSETRGTHREAALNEAQSELRRLTDLLEGLRHIQVSERVMAGDPAEAIAEVAAQVRPDFVAMATHGRTGLDRWLNGSVTEGVLRACDSPLLVGNARGLSLAGGDAPFHRLLVPLDGSELASEILPLAIQVALNFEAEVILQRVVADEETEAGGYLQQLARRMRERGVSSVKTVLQLGQPAVQILGAAEEYRCDLVVMSSHGRRGLDRLRFGSVTEAVMRACAAPLLVRRGDAVMN